MKVALLGATGNAGSRILDELLARGHQVSTIMRRPARLASRVSRQLTLLEGDASDGASLAVLLRGHDAALSAIKFHQVPAATLIQAVAEAGVPRYLVVGGAGSLQAWPGMLEMDRPDFPPKVVPEARLGADFLRQLRASDLDWSFLSPSRLFVPGLRSGRFRLGGEQLLFNAEGTSAISFEDYAMALVDELEHPAHSRQRFTVGY
ncbi:NAD(P)-dependent oxidoreductase [Pseudoxanthomonas sp.]|uniref:NAD(P)-dependent oxidoreductase n=1 Tax=Pseudoxanthomonas sp. TaxID=1871049 RepID=UPI00261E1DF6|nr:NAD(P)-dependent oxidoreductase [Pseudoxanthomonas sp.]WDS35027.1 MAG: NAD(P)-dependent oxidoreductase [Pseudoxanthomonas sp.]